MVDHDEALRTEVLARLAASREEMREILDPPRPAPGPEGVSAHSGGFPRSRTLQALMSGRGLGTLGAVAAGLVVARPALALRLLRMLPAGAVAKMLLAKAVTAVRAKRQ
ncbi:MAG: hypothetical protein NVS1B6_06530 [Steroidobacteraceae bacterium]